MSAQVRLEAMKLAAGLTDHPLTCMQIADTFANYINNGDVYLKNFVAEAKKDVKVKPANAPPPAGNRKQRRRRKAA